MFRLRVLVVCLRRNGWIYYDAVTSTQYDPGAEDDGFERVSDVWKSGRSSNGISFSVPVATKNRTDPPNWFKSPGLSEM